MTPVAAARLAVSRGTGSLSARGAGVADRVGDRAAVAGVAAVAAGLAAIIFAAKSATPIWDDGALVLTERLPASLASVLAPYHEHLVALPVLIWGQLSSPAQMLGLLLVTHLVLAVGTAVFLVRRVGAAAGFALCLPLAVLGTAHYDLVMPWQILFTIPLICGLAATAASLPRERTGTRRAVVYVSMVVAISCSMVGLFLVMALGLWFTLDRRPRQIWELAPAATLWGIWFLTFGLTGLGSDGASRASLAAILPYTLAALGTGVGGVLGLGTLAGLGALAAAAAWAAIRRPTIDPALGGFGLALVAMFMSASIFRAYGTADQATTSRYVYIVAFFLAFGIGAARPRVTLPAPSLVAIGIGAAILNVLALAAALPSYP